MKSAIHLLANHHRALSARLFIVEKMLDEMLGLMSRQPDAACYELVMDMDAIVHNISVIKNAKLYIAVLAEKYDTKKGIQSLKRNMKAKQTKIWEILSETSAKGLKGYGEFPEEHTAEFDADIVKLLEFTEEISV